MAVPASVHFKHDLFARFFDGLPRDTHAASRLAASHDAHLKQRARIAIDRNRRLRHAIEIRHSSFLDAAFISLLREHGIALVVADKAGRWPYVEEVTAGFMYLRLHGDKQHGTAATQVP